MSAADPPPQWQPGPRSLGRLCAVCGAPLRETAAACPRCGAADGTGTPAHLLTPFGHGLCGFIGVIMSGWALSFSLPATLPRYVGVLGPVVLAALTAWAASQLGRRLLPQWRCSYEHLLVAWMVGGPATLITALAGLTNPESLALVWVAAVAGAYLFMRRHGYRASDVR